MRIYTKVVTDIETGNVIESCSYDYAGPLELCKQKSRSPYIGSAASTSQQLQKSGAGDVATGVGLEKGAVTDPTSSPLYKALYSTEAGQMSKAYDTASSNQRAKAGAAGFGYSQPTTGGAESELRARQASDIGQLPGKVMSETVPMELQAGRDISGTGLGEEKVGADYFTGGVVPLEKQYQDYALNYTPLWQRMLRGGVSGLASTGTMGGGLDAALLAA